MTNPAMAVRRDVAQMIRPGRRMPVSVAGREYVRLQSPSGGTSHWDPTITPYMIEPMDTLTSREYEAVIFVGAAQSGKTQSLLDCWIAHTALCESADMMIIQTTQDTARDYERMRIRRLLRHSPEIKAEFSGSRQDDNTFDKVFRKGNVLKIGWPSENQLSGKSIRFIALTDYDRMPTNIGGEGSPFELAKKRTRKYLSKGMVLAESSPGQEVREANWTPSTPHEAPPAPGISTLFNLGDRRRFYWPCQHCGEFFLQPVGIEGFTYRFDRDLFGNTVPDSLSEVGVPCPKCGAVNEERHKRTMTRAGVWVPEGCAVSVTGVLSGQARKTTIASFWLPGAAAAYQQWHSLVMEYLRAQYQYEITGSEEALKTSLMQDMAAPYVARPRKGTRAIEDLMARAETMGKRVVPPGVRYLIAAIDVQGARFAVQVLGIGKDGESWLIDRYDIYKSERLDAGEPLPLDPAGYSEDWDILVSRVILSSYPLSDASDRRLSVFATVCDSGGKAGVTGRAYAFWERLRAIRLEERFFLVKGERPRPGTRQRAIKLSFPDNTTRTDRFAEARGEIPVWLLNTTEIKDRVDNNLRRPERGPGYIHLPEWLGIGFYQELVAEVRTESGWVLAKSGTRNEALDLLAYAQAAQLILEATDLAGLPINWERPPPWAAEWNDNSEILAADEQRPIPVAVPQPAPAPAADIYAPWETGNAWL